MVEDSMIRQDTTEAVDKIKQLEKSLLNAENLLKDIKSIGSHHQINEKIDT